MKMRIDKVLFELGYFESRKKAQVAIKKQIVKVKVSGKLQNIEKASEEIDPNDIEEWIIGSHPELDFVSRSGFKLSGALEKFNVDISGFSCLDVGLSTGGFSECLIRNGAQWVLGVDVGTNQLHPTMKAVRELVAFDKINGREPLPLHVMETFFQKSSRRSFDLIVIDVSFISVVPIIEAQLELLSPSGVLLALVKPQFEVGKDKIRKKGLVATEEGLLVLEKTVKTLKDLPLKVLGTMPAVIEGEDGNQEYFIFASRS